MITCTTYIDTRTDIFESVQETVLINDDDLDIIHNDLFFNIYTIGLGTSFYNLLVPLHTNILYNTNQISQTSNIQLISIIFNKLRIMS